jgi:hypothetical protein
MANCEPLFWYGTIVIAVCAWLVIVPYWRGKAELISAWNFMLGGIAIFIGVGSFEAATSPMRFPGLQWFEPTEKEVRAWMISTTVFLVAIFAAHYYDPFSKALAKRTFNKWPPATTGVLFFSMAFCFVLAIAAHVNFLLRVPVVGSVLVNVSHKAMIFCALFAFMLWYLNRRNLMWLGVFVGVLIAMAFLAVLAGGGRRMLLSVLVGPVLVFYFYQARYWRPTKSLAVIGVAVIGIFVVSLMYSTIRHFDRRGDQKGQTRDRSAGKAIEAIKNLSATAWYKHFAEDMLWSLSQHVVHYGMLTDRFVSTGQLAPVPMNTFKFFIVYPIPRAYYPNKPESLGRTITHKVLGRQTTWGTGVAGHAAYEGGLIIAALMGYFAAFGLRFFDDPLARQPTNPFLIGMLAAAGVQIVAWPRGDIAVMTFEIAECLLFVMALSFLFRFIFGTDKSRMVSRPALPPARVIYQAPAR